MNKSFALLVLTLSLTMGSPNGESLENNDKAESDPFMSCLLFGNEGCNIGCVIAAPLFHFQSRGSCDSDQDCICENRAGTTITLQDLWKQRFKSGDVLDYLQRSNNPAYNNVLEILQNNVFKTNEELKEAHDSAVSPYLFSKLETNDQHPIARFSKNGKFDKDALRRYVSEKLDEELKSETAKALLNVKYKEILKKALEKYKPCKASMYNYTFRIARIKNKHLENVLEEFFKENNMEKPKIEISEDRDPIHRIVGEITVSELINRIEGDHSKVETSEDANPSMSCVLFGEECCDIGCNITGKLFNFQSDGVCNSNNICTCYNYKDNKISVTVPNVKRTDDGGFDESSLEKYVSENLDEKLRSTSAKSLLDVNYKEKFRKDLEKHKGKKDLVFGYTFKVTELKIENLENILNEFLNENKMEKHDFGLALSNEDDNPIAHVNDIIVKELINRIERKPKEEIDKDVNPSIGCILFGKEACDLACVLYARLMNFPSYGVCDSSQICNCHNSKHSKISDAQRPAVRRISNDKFNETDLKKYVIENVDKRLKSNAGKHMLDVKYKEKFEKAMENSKNEKDFVPDYAFKIKHLKNKTLTDTFDDFLKKNNMKIPDSGVPDVPDVIYTILWVDNAITNTLIDRNDKHSKEENAEGPEGILDTIKGHLMEILEIVQSYIFF